MHIARAAPALLSSGVLIPLYLFPSGGPDCTNWAPLRSTITAHPSVPFYIIINPESGPEGSPGSQPPTPFQQCVPQLLEFANVITLGYVITGFGAADRQAGVLADVNTYAGWASSYRPAGIFFDEVSNVAADFETYENFTTEARSLFSFITLNPGTALEDTRYYGIADLLLTDETFFDQFNTDQLSLGTDTPASKQAVVLHDGPSNPPTDLISELISTDGLKAFYVTDDTQANGGNPYDDLPTDLESFVAAIESAAET